MSHKFSRIPWCPFPRVTQLRSRGLIAEVTQPLIAPPFRGRCLFLRVPGAVLNAVARTYVKESCGQGRHPSEREALVSLSHVVGPLPAAWVL